MLVYALTIAAGGKSRKDLRKKTHIFYFTCILYYRLRHLVSNIYKIYSIYSIVGWVSGCANGVRGGRIRRENMLRSID